jgi:hypothetical protein
MPKCYGVILTIKVFSFTFTERILMGETTEEIHQITISKSFTTERKTTTINISRKGSIVKEKCKQLTEIALDLFPDRRIPHEDLTFLIMRYIGCDKETIRNYAGYYGTVKRRASGEGYVVGKQRKGYLEIFDFMHRVNFNEWVIHAQTTLSKPFLEHHNNEGLSQICSKEKLSLPIHDAGGGVGEGHRASEDPPPQQEGGYGGRKQ